MAAKATAGDSAQADGSGTQAAEGGAQPGADAAAPPVAAPDAPDGTSGTAPDGTGAQPPAAPDDVKVPSAQDGTPAAAPLTPPLVKATATLPAPPPVDPGAAVRQAPDGGHIGIVGADGEPLSHDELFTEAAPHHTWMVVARDIFEKFRYPGQHRETVTHSMQLVARAGTRLPRDQAHALIEAARGGSTDNGDGENATG